MTSNQISSQNRSMYRQVVLLSTAQALFQTVSVLVMTVGGLAGSQLAPEPWLATAPIASMFLGTAIATVPASMWMSRVGRKNGFVVGATAGVLGGLVAAWGIQSASLIALCIGTLFVGIYQGFAQFYRFAASEIATDTFRPKAISFVMAGGIVAALAGPALGRLGGPLMQPAYTASFLILSAVSLVAVGILAATQIPQEVTNADATDNPRPLSNILRQPTYLVALFGAITGYGIMILAMTATPLAMHHHNHGLGDTATVIQLHVLGMFLPSFFTGSLISRFGVLRIMLSGIALLLGHVAMSLSGTGFYSFSTALVLLGVGWNFLYIGGTNLLTRTYTTSEKGKAQAFNDFSIFLVGLASSLGAGALQNVVGWQTLNMLLVPWLVAAALAIIALELSSQGKQLAA